jgi:hypothetical protein
VRVKPATYLLKAPEQDMQRWRAAADARRLSLAAFAREALDALAAQEPAEVQVTLEEMRDWPALELDVGD